ncbi:MAG: hypothetical protein WCT49_04155 [Candidatus Paceibacterota bacterium]|nr:hypothetical protein [Candidatus Paceibacterota bacterium]
MCDQPHLVFDLREIDDPSELSHSELIERQLAEILGEDNRRYAQDALGREASIGDLIVHYCKNGGPQDFQRRHGRQTCIVSIDYLDQ